MGDVDTTMHEEASRDRERPLPLSNLLASAPHRSEDLGRSTAIAFLLHALVIAGLVWLSMRTNAFTPGDQGVGTGIGAGIAGGGGGGGAAEDVTYIQLPPAPASAPAAPDVAQVQMPVPALEIAPVVPPPLDMMTPPTVTVAAAPLPSTGGTGTGEGAGQGAGTGPGQGPGSGGGSGGGEGGGIGSGVGPGIGRGRVLGPSPTVILMPPVATRGVRGKTVVVRLDVDSTGVVRQVELAPPTGDRSYDNALRRVALGWKFKPARDSDNKAVPAAFEVTFTF